LAFRSNKRDSPRNCDDGNLRGGINALVPSNSIHRGVLPDYGQLDSHPGRRGGAKGLVGHPMTVTGKVRHKATRLKLCGNCGVLNDFYCQYRADRWKLRPP
jgi:hypothetical protein